MHDIYLLTPIARYKAYHSFEAYFLIIIRFLFILRNHSYHINSWASTYPQTKGQCHFPTEAPCLDKELYDSYSNQISQYSKSIPNLNIFLIASVWEIVVEDNKDHHFINSECSIEQSGNYQYWLSKWLGETCQNRNFHWDHHEKCETKNSYHQPIKFIKDHAQCPY